ncbi:PAC2 family protein [Chloroflexota bacterium]
MKKSFKILANPKLNSPIMLAAWPGICNVSMIIANYLMKKIDFEKLAVIEASHFFDPIGVVVKNNVIEKPQFPQSKFYYWKNKRGSKDIVLFIGDDQPSTKGYELANCVIDVGVHFKVSQIYTCAAALTRVHHTEEPKTWGVVSNQKLINELEKYDLVQRGNLHISGLNGLLLGVAKEREIDGICLLGEVPSYATRMQNPIAAIAILKVLVKILGIEIDMFELAQSASETKEKMKQVAAEAMGEYIDLFTEPIWENNDDITDEEE